jgi:hypothetical protein
LTLASLPKFDIWIAFNPTASSATLATANQQQLPASGASNTYWTNVSQYVRDFTTKTGKQHYLDRVEAATLKMTLNNRDGYFNNATVNGQSAVLGVRMPVAIMATYGGVSYNVYWGIIDSITEKVGDQINSDLDVEASDLTKYLSLKYLYRPSFWKNYALSTSTKSWYRCSNYTAVTVTSAHGNGSTIVYQAQNTFSVGQVVTIQGLAGISTLNQANATITAATSTSFTISAAVTGDSTSAGLAYLTTLYDYGPAGSNGQFVGQVSFPEHGVIIYDTDGCADLSGTSNVAGAALQIISPSNCEGIELWILGQQVQGNQVLNVTSGGNAIQLLINQAGVLTCNVNGTLTATATIVNDGYWHHVGVICNSSSVPELYCDGVFYSLGLSSTQLAAGSVYVGENASAVASYNGQVDEIIVSGNASVSTLATEVQQRYRAGTLLQLGFPVTTSKVLSGDRIAEVLTLAGMGTITGGSISAQATVSTSTGSSYLPNTLLISNSYQNPVGYSAGSSGNGFAATEPYYWDSPVTQSSALDLIQQITDTDIGSFFQWPDGSLHFFTQNYYGTWSFTANTPPASPTTSWTPRTFTSPGVTLSDDNSGYAYDPTSLEVVLDDADLWTTVRITPQAGVDQIYENTSAEGRYGFSTLTKSSTVSSSLNDALSSAYFLGYIFRSPLPRVNAVTLLSETGNGTNVTTQLSLNFGDVITFKRTPPNASGSGIINLSVAIESITHEFNAEPGYFHTTLMLDPYPVRS